MMSWPRSHGFERSGGSDLEDVEGYTPSDIRAFEDDASLMTPPSDAAASVADPGVAGAESRWRCTTCQSTSWDWVDEQYQCRQCGNNRFFDTTRPFRVDTNEGVWVFEPRSSPDQSPDSSKSSFELFGSVGNQQQATRPSSPPEPDDGQWNDGEYAESEQLTHDPSVDPDASELGGRRRRRRRRANPERTTTPPAEQQVGMSDLVNVMKQLVHERASTPKQDTSSVASWNSRREPGIKWRGGTPPSPPLWKYSSSDLRAFSRWEKKIRIWQLQVRNYVSAADSALMLFTSLTGEAEQEVEHIDLAKVNTKDGVDYLLDALRGPLQQKELFQKRKLLSDYEMVGRMNHESIRQYINRYRRIEKDLESIGISSSTMYDSESRGNRVLERAKLSPEFQRLVLIGAGNTLEFDRVCESLLLQFPDFKPVPPIFTNYAGTGGSHNSNQGWRSSSGKGKGHSSASSSSSTTSGSSTGVSSFSKSSGKGRFPRRVMQTDVVGEQDDEPNEELPTVEEGDEDEFLDPAEDQEQFDDEDEYVETESHAAEPSLESTIAEIAEVLTVTSKKLQSSVLGRKFTGRKSIEERKKNSSCSACGQMGHWAGDAACPVSSKGSGKDGGKSSGKQQRGSSSSNNFTNKPKKAFVVTLPQNQVEAQDSTTGSQQSTFFTYMLSHINPSVVHESFVTEIIDFAGYMVLDTACQRSCCSFDWLRIHNKILQYHNMCVKQVDATDVFQFGAGGPKTSTTRAYIPAALDGQDTQGILFGASVVEASIPFLASRTLLERLGCIIDFANGRLHVTKLGLQVPLMLKHGHLAIKIACFPKGSSRDVCWKTLSQDQNWIDPDPELITTLEALVSSKQSWTSSTTTHVVSARHQDSSNMAEGMEGVDHQGHDDPVPHLSRDVQDGEIGFQAKTVAHSGRTFPAAPGADSGGATSTGMGLHPCGLPEVRQSSRPFCRMQEVLPEVQMGRQRGRVAGSWWRQIGKFYALASSLIFQHHPTFLGGDGESGGYSQEAQQSNFGVFRQEQGSGLDSPASTRDSNLGTPWHDVRAVRRDHVGTEQLSAPRLRRQSGWISGGPGEGVSDRRFLLSEHDHWEVNKGFCIRHHLVPRLMSFDLHQCSDCPVQKHLLDSRCVLEAEFNDGKVKTIEYNWMRDAAIQLNGVWIGRTTFKIKSTPNTSTGFLSSVARRRLRTGIREALQVFHLEQKVMDDHGFKVNKLRTRVDVMETFAGQANISKQAGRFGLKAAHPVDYNTGFDLAQEQDQEAVQDAIQQLCPLVLIQGIDCRDWCLLQDNVNYIRRKILLLMRRRKARKVLVKAVDWCWLQLQNGRYFLLENPLTSRLWHESSVVQLMAHPDVLVVECHAGAYGAVNSKGQMIRKGHRWMTNSQYIANRLQLKLTAEQQQQCVPLEGKETTLSQVYCPGLVDEISRGVRETARHHDPERFINKHVTWAASVISTDHDTWLPAFQLAEQTFNTTRFKNFVLPTSDTLYDLVKQLTNWRLERVQISLQPAVMRFPSHVPHTHRGWALSFADGTFEVGHEDLAQTRHPRARFSKPVRLGIFFFGYAESGEEDNQQPPVLDDPSQLVGYSNVPGFTFKKGAKVSPEVRSAVIRLHRNLGHPHATDLKKLLAMNGIKNQQVLDAVDALECDSCIRTKGPGKPPPASIPQEGYLQFGDAVQMDIFYVRDIAGKNYMFLGVIDEVTHLHLACLTQSRSPAEISSRFQTAWVRPFGWPLKLKTDPDPAFRGDFEADMNEAGCFVDYVPPESHHRMGLIERHNATMRSLMERCVDSRATTGESEMELVATAASFAKNACTWSSGRPPYIAAFGRIPRMGLDLLSDANGLVAGSTRSEVHQQASLLRAEAQQHLAAMSVDAGFRRALLRKSSTEQIVDVSVGSVVAYWRWTSKSSKKRGGFRLARLLGRDPDGKSMWLQAGTNTIKVAQHQLRIARGFEQWNPDHDDIKQLRAASDNLQSNFLQDESLPEPDRLSESGSQLQGIDQPEFLDDTVVEELPFHAVPEPGLIPVPPPVQEPPPQHEEAVQTDGYEPEPQRQQQPIQFNVSSPTHINIHQQNLHQQQTFGMTPDQLRQPAVRTPVRKPYLKSQPQTPRQQQLKLPLSVPKSPSATPQLRLQNQPDDLQNQSAPSSARGSQLDRERVVAPGTSMSSQATLHDRTAPQTPPLSSVPEVIDVDALPPPTLEQQVGQSVPSTPPELRLTPAKRPASPATSSPSRRQSTTTVLLTSTQTDDVSRPGPQGGNDFSFGIQRNPDLQLDAGDVFHDVSEQQDRDDQCSRQSSLTEQVLPGHNGLILFDDGIQLRHEFFDGTADFNAYRPNDVCFQHYKKAPDYAGDGQSDDSDSGLDDVAKPPLPAEKKLTRLEQKALDKEIPWQRIMDGPDHVLQAFIKAAQSEEASWMSWQSVRALDAQEANKIFSDSRQRRRILRSRAAFRDKAKGVPPLKPKCRIVALGHLDPDLFSLSRESATPCRQSEYLLLSIFVSGRNGMLLSGNGQWCLWSGDVKTAFLQGCPEPRKDPLYLLPPHDGVCRAAKIFSSPLYEIKGNVYGLANAPRTWGLHVIRTLVQSGWKQSSLDKMLFYRFAKFAGEKQPILAAVLLVYVDDFLLAHDQRFSREELIKHFTWGSQEELSLDNPLDFKGKQLVLKRDHDKFVLSLNQTKFIDAITGGHVAKKQFSETVKPEDMSEFRSVAGSLQWVAGQTRPDVASTVSLSCKGTKSTYQNLNDMYQAIEHLQNTKDSGFVMTPTAISESTIVVCYSDSSWANAEGYTSQHGCLTLLANPRVTDQDGGATLVDWKSSRSGRVCRSTLAAEASACDTALDRGAFISAMLTELLTDVPSYKQTYNNRLVAVTDCRSLYDVLCSENPNTDEKRTIITIRSCQQYVQRADVFWVPTGLEWADGLTKIQAALMNQFHQWLQRPWIKLHE